MLLVIDRIDDGICVCEALPDGRQLKFAAAALPAGAKEGSVLGYDGGILSLNAEETAKRTAYIKKLMDDVLEN